MRKKTIRGLLCLLILVVLGGCGKAKDESASTEEIVPVEEMEQAETINNTDDTEEENTEAVCEKIKEAAQEVITEEKLRQSWRWLIMKVRMQCRKIHVLPVAEPENVRNVKVMAIGKWV